MNDDANVTLSDSAVFTPLGDGDAVVLELTRKRYYQLNDTALAIVERLRQGPATVAALVEAVTQGFEVDRETAAQDVREYLAELVRRKVVTIE